ncbi:MAG TPA: polysaccharide deacetylase [Candidatus Aphodoplasma excrementigallinarum]|uniref:Polysaccharide deacetylase n=1 Tax=Candidatus Aphodoplasma excrementigallinarum TaxID=2840673 RepID=A0A9D1NIV7_9FIRM|nr:polysaccharide deacetylase [Candidatus Aphodoplasma excrementigallinarum]
MEDRRARSDSVVARRIQQRRRQRKKKAIINLTILAIIVIALIIGIVWGVRAWIGAVSGPSQPANAVQTPAPPSAEEIIRQADFLAAGYDYDAAIEKIKSYGPGYTEKPELTEAISGYEATKATMVRHEDVTDITHVFFHTLIVDPSKAFDGDTREAGYNQYMTTISEFNKILEEMYARGFVLVDIHDIAREEVQDDGTTKFVPGDIMLPEGKKPFVMSQDDVSYYGYMTGDGFASRLVIGDDGYPTNEYVQDDGTVVRGDFDLVPLLEHFIQEHPDFSYKGARATLALTGYDGVLGYRTCPTADDYKESDIAEAKKVADRMKELGWTFASHSWGHKLYGSTSAAKLAEDAKKWDEQVRPIVGDTDVLIYAHGEDIAGIGKYSGEKFETLKSYGFKYFCNVDSAKAWVQIQDDYVRQGRRNLDGYRMWYNPELLEDLFIVDDVWDKTRPTPVPPI